jgi:hypothetical protein
MQLAQLLDFDKRNANGLRPSRFDDVAGIKVEKRSIPDHTMRWVIVLIAREWGFHQQLHTVVTSNNNNPSLTANVRLEIVDAACRLMPEDWGFHKPPKGHQVKFWTHVLDNAMKDGRVSLKEVLCPKEVGNLR